MDQLKVFSGTGHWELAKGICDYLEIPLGEAQTFKFSNDNTFVRILENIRAKDVFILQPISYPVNDNLMELLIFIDAAKRASAGRITAVIPYYGYGRTDKKDQPRVPITARLVADLITTAGASRVLTLDLHAAQIQGFFNIPVDELTAFPMLARHWKEKGFKDLVVVASDIGISKRARDVAARLEAPLAIMEKRRIGNDDRAEGLNVIGDVAGKVAVTVDDEIDTAGTLVEAAHSLREAGAREVYSCAIHPVFSGPALDRIEKSAVKQVVVTDSIPPREGKSCSKVTTLTVAPLLGEAIRRIHFGLSVGEMFE